MSRIVPEVFEINPGIVRAACGDLTEALIRIMRAQRTEQRAWANQISEGREKYVVVEPWRSAFARFGEEETVSGLSLRAGAWVNIA